MKTVQMRQWASKAAFNTTAIFLALAFAFPVVWIIYSSFKTPGEIFTSPWPTLNPTLNNFIVAWQDMHYPQLFMNSSIVMIGTTVPCTIVSALAAYAFARLKFPGKHLLFLLVIGGILVPMQVTIIPLFLLLKQMQLVNSYGGIVFPLIARWLPTGTFILTGFYRVIPKEFEESARVDGASTYTIFRRIILPISTKALATVAILVALQSWAEFLLPLVVARDQSLYTLPLGIMAFQHGYYYTDWNLVFAGLSMSIIPTILAYLALHNSFEIGITSGAIKA